MSIRRSRAVWIAAVVLGVAVAGAALVQVSDAPPETAAIDTSTASATPSPALSPDPGPSSTSQPPAGPATPEADPPTGTPAAPGAPAPVEETPSEETPAAGPFTLPPSEPVPDPVSRPFPTSASAEGKLVKGFPTLVIPPAPRSSVTNSAVASEGNRLQVTLSAESSLTVEEVLDFYRTELAQLGLLDSPAPALSGSSALLFARGSNTVTLSAETVKGGSRYLILGSFTAPS